MARKRLPECNAAPLPWLVAPAIAGAEFDSSTKNTHETHTRIVLYLQRKGPRWARGIPFCRSVSRTVALRAARRQLLRDTPSLLPQPKLESEAMLVSRGERRN